MEPLPESGEESQRLGAFKCWKTAKGCLRAHCTRTKRLWTNHGTHRFGKLSSSGEKVTFIIQSKKLQQEMPIQMYDYQNLL